MDARTAAFTAVPAITGSVPPNRPGANRPAIAVAPPAAMAAIAPAGGMPRRRGESA